MRPSRRDLKMLILMKRSIKLLAFVIIMIVLFTSMVLADNVWNGVGNGNPVIPAFFADPSLHVFNNTYYLYSTTDGYGWNNGPPMLWKSTDCVHWTSQFVIINPNPNVYWAPSVVFNHVRQEFPLL